jgi:hypothetical protein
MPSFELLVLPSGNYSDSSTETEKGPPKALIAADRA